MNHKYLINTKPEFELLIKYLEEVDIFAFDTETNGHLDRFKVSIVGISFGFDLFSVYIPLHHLVGRQLDHNFVMDLLRPIFEDRTKQCIAHNAKFDEMVLDVHGTTVQNIAHDTMTMAWLLDESVSKHGLKKTVYKYLGIRMQTYEDVVAAAPKKRGQDRDFNFARVSLDNAVSYAADDAYYTYQLYEIFRQEFQRQNLTGAYERIERPINRTLANMERIGVSIDLDGIQQAAIKLPALASEIEGEIYEQAGEVFNIASGKQLGEVIYGKMGIGKNIPRTKAGRLKTNVDTLEIYAAKNQIIQDILRLKKIHKLNGTFVEGLRKFIKDDGKIHASFDPQGTVTGRFSSNRPNLQNIIGDEIEEIKVRDFFIPSEGYSLVVADYGQIEYRVMAHVAKDKKMIKALTTGHDFHEETARIMFSIPAGEVVSRVQRTAAKAINFGIGYGRGFKSVAEALECTNKEAKQYIADWERQFYGVVEYKEHLVETARKRGYVRTLSGRKRRLPELRSDDWLTRGHAERQAFNTRIQGSAADIIKLAMISLEPALAKLGARMLIQVHDEIVVEALIGTEEEVAFLMQEIMEHPLNGVNPLCVPLVTEPKVVEKWSEAK